MLPQALKLKVIQQYQAGKLQKDIAHDLGISTGSVSTILKASRGRQKHEDNSDSNLTLSTLQEQQPIASEKSKPEQAIIIATPTSICNASPSSNYGDGLKPEPDPKTLGGPLKFFLNKIVSPTAAVAAVAIASTTEYNNSSNSVNLNLNPIKADEDVANSNLHPPAPVSTLSIPPKVEPFPDRYLFIKDPETEMQDNIIESYTNVKYINQDVNSQNAMLAEKDDGEFELPQLQSQSKNPSVTIDWDQSWERTFWARAMEEREERRKELELIQRRQQELDEQKRQIENTRQDLEARENKLRSVEDLIPSSKQLKDIGISFDQALVWVDCIKEVAQKERVEERTASWKLADMLRSFKTLSGLEKAITKAEQKLLALDAFTTQKQAAITTLMNLQMAGFSEKEINELTGLVNTWNARSGIARLSQSNGNGCKKLDTELIGVGH